MTKFRPNRTRNLRIIVDHKANSGAFGNRNDEFSDSSDFNL